MNIWCDFGAVVLREDSDHFFDLHDLFGRAAEKAEQSFAKWLTRNPQSGKRRDTVGDMRIAAPRERVGEGREIIIET